eukprot:TRINITY_DN626_c0_g1_i8.p1 TRINITY_DN626_c0_g1~~TRINITY_DN626_c0_g1_i8.p1  ORF type:complete len:439 (+),score=142.02 TRINITY_DN626_c0_g1_i8:88-1404(+)
MQETTRDEEREQMMLMMRAAQDQDAASVVTVATSIEDDIQSLRLALNNPRTIAPPPPVTVDIDPAAEAQKQQSGGDESSSGGLPALSDASAVYAAAAAAAASMGMAPAPAAPATQMRTPQQYAPFSPSAPPPLNYKMMTPYSIVDEPWTVTAAGPSTPLAVNRQYQGVLSAMLKKIEAALQLNTQLQKKLLGYCNQQKAQRSRTAHRIVPGQPYIVDRDGNHPSDNPDTKRRKKNNAQLPTEFKVRKWNNSEIKALLRGVRTFRQQVLLNATMTEYKRDKKPLELFNKEMERIRQMPDTELLRTTEGVDWEGIAKQYVSQRSGLDCRLRWTCVDSPLLNNTAWTKDEDLALLKVAKAHEGHDWEQIAAAMGTGRLPFQCFTRYQRSLNAGLLKSKWAPEEDEKLKQAVLKYGEKNWQQVANCLEGRMGQQCLHRWTKG